MTAADRKAGALARIARFEEQWARRPDLETANQLLETLARFAERDSPSEVVTAEQALRSKIQTWLARNPSSPAQDAAVRERLAAIEQQLAATMPLQRDGTRLDCGWKLNELRKKYTRPGTPERAHVIRLEAILADWVREANERIRERERRDKPPEQSQQSQKGPAALNGTARPKPPKPKPYTHPCFTKG